MMSSRQHFKAARERMATNLAKTKFMENLPATNIPEILEIREEMKAYDGVDFLSIYNSKLTGVLTKIQKRLSPGYCGLLKKTYDNLYVPLYINQSQPVVIAIEENHNRITKAVGAVEAKRESFRKSIAFLKKNLVPIVESKSFEETVAAIEKIPLDAKYFPSEGGFLRVPYYCGFTLVFPKAEFGRPVGALLEELLAYREGDMLTEIVPLIREARKTVYLARKIAKEKWLKKYCPSGKMTKGHGIALHNAIGHITIGLGMEVDAALERIKYIYASV